MLIANPVFRQPTAWRKTQLASRQCLLPAGHHEVVVVALAAE